MPYLETKAVILDREPSRAVTPPTGVSAANE
jgi:hypothetical protein